MSESGVAEHFFSPGSRMTDVRSGRTLSASEAAEIVAAQASALQGAGRVVAIGHVRAFDTILALLAVWEAGRDALLVSPKLSAEEQANVAAFAGVSDWLGPLHDGVNLPVKGAEQPDRPPSAILMTSGTTGKPKGIRLSVAAIAARVRLNEQAIGRPDMARTLCLLPAFFGHGLIGNCLTPLAAGAELFLLDGPDIAEHAGIGALIDKLGVTFMSSVPSFWKLACRLSPRPQNGSLARVHVGSAPLSMEQWRAIADWAGTENVLNMFGMTETANWISGAALDEASGRDGHVGRPWGGEFAVLGEGGNIAGKGKGEVLVRSPTIMDHYTGDPEKTAEAFVEGWFRTGDIGVIDDVGALTLTGRTKWEINRSGIKIQAEEIDMLLERHPDIVEACAFGIPDAVAGEAVAAAIVLRPGAETETEAIRAWCRTRARPDAVPAALYRVEMLAKNERGKLDRKAVRASALGAKP